MIKAIIENLKYKHYLKTHNREKINNLLRKRGVTIGTHCNICTNIRVNEPYLISIGDNCIISYNVNFITHDASFGAISGKWGLDFFGKINIQNNVFVGANSSILYGVTIGANSIIAAGSVVTRSFPENSIIGGVPAKLIGNSQEYFNKNQYKLIDTNGMTYNEKKNLLLNSKKLVTR